MFRTVPLSIIRSFSLYIQQWYISYSFADSLRTESGRNWLVSAYNNGIRISYSFADSLRTESGRNWFVSAAETNEFIPDLARKLSSDLYDTPLLLCTVNNC